MNAMVDPDAFAERAASELRFVPYEYVGLRDRLRSMAVSVNQFYQDLFLYAHALPPANANASALPTPRPWIVPSVFEPMSSAHVATYTWNVTGTGSADSQIAFSTDRCWRVTANPSILSYLWAGDAASSGGGEESGFGSGTEIALMSVFAMLLLISPFLATIDCAGCWCRVRCFYCKLGRALIAAHVLASGVAAALFVPILWSTSCYSVGVALLHELGHAHGMRHVDDRASFMYAWQRWEFIERHGLCMVAADEVNWALFFGYAPTSGQCLRRDMNADVGAWVTAAWILFWLVAGASVPIAVYAGSGYRRRCVRRRRERERKREPEHVAVTIAVSDQI